jgi:putative transposase
LSGLQCSVVRLNGSGANDNGPKFVSKALNRLAYERGVTLDFPRPGKLTDNGLVESFNGRLRDECLDTPLIFVARGLQAQDRGPETGR